MSSQIEELQRAIAALEAQRTRMGDAVVDTALVPLREKLFDLTAKKQPVQQRKLVTILFLDVVDSTVMVRDLDPEDNLALMDGALKRLTVPVKAHGGRIVKYTGDGLVALFGHPIAYENDPVMAVQAGLAMLDITKEYAQEVKSQGVANDFAIRIGVNTGLAIIGGGSEGENTLAGSTINLAARLESAAPTGGLLISHNTYQQVRGFFNIEQKDPVEAKGFDEPQAVYLVTGIKPPRYRQLRRGVEGVPVRMVGRDNELAMLQNAFNLVIKHSECQMITLVGEAGIGKSRLLAEFSSWLDLQSQDARVLQGKAMPQSKGLPYGLLRDIFVTEFDIQEDELLDSVRKKIERGFLETFTLHENAEKKAHYLGQLLGFDFRSSPHLEKALSEPKMLREEALKYLNEYIRIASLSQPVIVFLEDVHWADDSSLDAVEAMAKALSTRPLLLVALSRRNLYQRRPEWGTEQAFQKRLDLHALSERDSLQLLAEVLQNLEDIPDRLRDLVFTNAEGNPFYVEELVKMLIEEGVILKEEPHWRVQSERLYDIKVPPSLAGVLQARLDRLPADVRTVLQQASVIGRIFWDDALVAFHDQADDQTYTAVVNDSLNLLRDREMVFQRQSSAFAGTKERIFKHILLRDVTYETVLKRLRLSYHRLAADWLIANSKERLDEMAGVIAAHLDAAGDNLRAIKYFRQAAAIAKALYAHQEAINHLKRAIELAAEEQEERDLIPQLYEALGDSLTITGKFASAEEAYQAALACLPTGEPVELAELERKLAATLPPQQREAESEAIYLAALARLDRSPPTTVDQRWQSIRLNNLLGLQDVLYFLHQPEAMSELKEQTQALLDEVGTAEQHASFYSRLNQMSFLQNRYYMSSENVALARKALRYAQKSENARLIARQRFHLGFSLLWHGDLDDAVAVLQKSLATAKELGDSWLQNQCLVYLTIPYRLQGNISQVMVLQPDLIEISRQVGNKTYIGVSLANAAWLHYRAGEWRQAQAQAEAAVATWDSTMYPFQWLALWILLAVALQRDRLPDAIDVARAMLDSEQQQQEGVHVFLEKAVAAWEANDQSTSQIRLATAVELASQHSYV